MRRAVVVLVLVGFAALGAVVIDRPPPLWRFGLVRGNAGSPPPPPPYFDSGFPGFPAGTYSWAGECMGIRPASTGHDILFGGVVGGAGALVSCCKQDGNCNEIYGGGDPNYPDSPMSIDHAQIPETQVYLQAGTTDRYGLVAEPETYNIAFNTRDIADGGWTCTGTLTPNAYVGPFGVYLEANAMVSLEDTSALATHQCCQTEPIAVGPGGRYAASAWLRADDAGSARISMTGVGDSAGDRECTYSSLDTSATGTRYGCVGTANYGAGLTAITTCISVGSTFVDTGKIGLSDVQVEREQYSIGAVSSYIPNPTTDPMYRGTTGMAWTTPFTEMTSDAGCMSAGFSRHRYDAEDYFFRAIAPLSVPQMAFQWENNAGATTGLVRVSAVVDLNTSVGPVFDAYKFVTTGWDSTTLTLTVQDAGTVSSGSFHPPMWNGDGGARTTVGSDNGAASNAFTGLFGPYYWGTDPAGCLGETVINNANPGVLLIGDQMSVRTNAVDGYTDPDDSWARYVSEVYIRNPSNTALIYYHVPGSWGGEVARLKWAKMQDARNSKLAWWVGQNDVLNGYYDAGVNLWNDMIPYVKRKGHMGIQTYFFNLSPIEGAAGLDGGQEFQRAEFNSHWDAYCDAGASVNVKCVNVWATLVVPDGGNRLNPLYDYGDHIRLNDAGNLAVAQKFESVFP